MRAGVPLLMVLLAGLAGAQGRADKLRAEYERRSLTLLLEVGERHLDYGLKLRDQGLVAQAAEQIRLAVELSERRLPHANAVLSLMRQYDDRFWKRRVEPGAKRLDAYEKKARKLAQEDGSDRLDLAGWAWDKGLHGEARATFELLVAAADGPLELDRAGRVVLDVGKLPAEVSEELVAEAVTINGLLYLRDDFLRRCSELKEVYEHASERLLVRCQTSVEDARALHALAAALLPHLEDELGGRPARRPHVFVFAARADYESYLDAAGLGAWKSVSGMADLARNTAVVCAEQKPLDQLQGLLLHELTHLVEHGVSPARLPEWCREGLAEAFGGPGTFRWDGEELVAGLPLARARLEAVLEDGLRWSLAAMHAVDPLTLWTSDRELALRFYAQSWALYRYLRREAPEDVRARFDEWLTMCRGTGAGLEAQPGTGATAASAAQLFERLFASDLARIEEGFVEWLREQ